MFALIVVASAFSVVAHGQDAASIASRVERAPWGGPIAVVECEGRIVVSSTTGVFVSAEGRAWTRDRVPEDSQILDFACIDGSLFGIGRPGLIVRREHDGSWREEHRIEDRPDGWNRRAELVALSREGSRLVAWGFDGAGEPIQVARNDEGRWRDEPPRVRRRSPPRECAMRARRAGAPSGEAIRRVVLCPWRAPTRAFVWSEHTSGAPDRAVRLPRRADGDWRLIGVAGEAFFVMRRFAGDDVSDEITHHEIARLEGGRWNTVTVEDPQMWSGLIARERELLLFGEGRLYRIDATTGR